MDDEVRSVDVGGLTFTVRLAGPSSGAPVVLLHGFPQTSASWDPIVPALTAAGHRVIAPDQRGYSPGASPAAVSDYAFGDLVGDVIGLFDGLDIDRAAVVGHDWGGAVAWQLAAHHPDRVSSVAVLQTPFPLAFARALQRSWQARLRFSYAAVLRIRGSERLLAARDGWLLRRVLRLTGWPPGADVLTDPERLRTAQNWYRAFSGRALKSLPAVEVPALYLFGDRDPVFLRESALATERHCTGPYRLIEITDGGHWIVDTHTDVVADALVEHLAAHDG